MNKAQVFIDALSQLGIRHCFIVTGGAAMFLNQAVASHGQITTVAVHHEQSATMAAEGYFKSIGKVALVSVTAGPGAINSLNGVFGAYTDSVPMIVVSGQVRTNTLRLTPELRNLRQLGDQEVDIVSMVSSIVKKVFQVDAEQDVRELARIAHEVSTSGRPGPVWIDFPIDIQSQRYESHENSFGVNKKKDFESIKLENLVDEILSAKRPLFLFGTGVSNDRGRLAIEKMQQFSSIPIQPAWTAIDLVPFDSKLFAGRPSTVGDRAGGLIQRAADLHIVFGSSLSLRQVGFNSKDQFKGKIVQIDVDPNYCFKPFPRVETHITIDPTLALEFIVQSLERREEPGAFKGWLNRCRKTVLDYRQEVTWFQEIDDGLNPYRFLRHLSEQAPQDSLFVCANATAAVVFFQVANLKKNQRTFSNAGSASMGYDLPASIGAAYSTDRPVICLAGDGSIQMNIQELATISGNNLDIRILLLDNQGYLSIRASQINHFKETFYESTSNGLFFPKWKEIAEAYSLPYFEVNRNNLNLDHLNSRGPHLTHVSLSPSFTFTPKASSRLDSNGRIASSPIYDLEPFIEETLLQGILADLISETEVIP